MSLELGNIGELEFQLAATKKGLIVSKPTLNNIVYDLIVDTNNKIYKIQVKANFSSGSTFGFNVSKGSNIKRSYSKKEVDYIVCFINYHNIWYIFPIDKLCKIKKISLFPDAINSRWHKYKDAWHLLK